MHHLKHSLSILGLAMAALLAARSAAAQDSTSTFGLAEGRAALESFASELTGTANAALISCLQPDRHVETLVSGTR